MYSKNDIERLSYCGFEFDEEERVWNKESFSICRSKSEVLDVRDSLNKGNRICVMRDDGESSEWVVYEFGGGGFWLVKSLSDCFEVVLSEM